MSFVPVNSDCAVSVEGQCPGLVRRRAEVGGRMITLFRVDMWLAAHAKGLLFTGAGVCENGRVSSDLPGKEWGEQFGFAPKGFTPKVIKILQRLRSASLALA